VGPLFYGQRECVPPDEWRTSLGDSGFGMVIYGGLGWGYNFGDGKQGIMQQRR